MSLARALADACRAVPHPVGLLARDGALLAASPLFAPPLYPLPERGIFPEGGRDLLVIPLGELQLVVELPTSPVADVAEAALLVRKLAQIHRRTREELESALSEAEFLKVVAETERHLADPTDAALALVARLFRPLVDGKHVHLLVKLPGGLQRASGPGQPLTGTHLFRHKPAPDVEAYVLVEGPVPQPKMEVFQLLVERLGAAAIREALRAEQGLRAAAERAAAVQVLAREAAPPLDALLADLERAAAGLAPTPAVAEPAGKALQDALAAARRVLEVVNQLRGAGAGTPGGGPADAAPGAPDASPVERVDPPGGRR